MSDFFGDTADLDQGRSGSVRGASLFKAATLMGTTILATGSVFTAPALADGSSLQITQGSGNITIGAPTVAGTTSKLTITTNTARTVVQGNIDIGSDEHWHIQQNAGSSSRTLLRDVTSDPSMIFGLLTSNGEIFLINPNGIVFGEGAVVDAASFVATTANITDQDFVGDRLNFLEQGVVDAAIINKGTISAQEGGLVALVAPTIQNDGVIQAKLGKVVLAAGDAFTVDTIDLYGDDLISFAAPRNLTGEQSDFEVSNTGQITADGGRVILTAKAAGAIVDSVINTSGIIQANTINEQDGVISLLGGDGTTTSVSGKLVASAPDAGSNGGRIVIAGETVAIGGDTEIDASGHSGGGTILIGGGFQGQGDTYRAQTTTVAQTAELSADAIADGDGGTVVVWSDKETVYQGAASAQGGAHSGDGGLVEVSSKTTLTFDGTADTRAANGETGTLLLDPTNITISGAANSANNVNVGTLTGQLAANNVTVTTAAPGADVGDIDVNAAVTWNAATTLTLQADNDVRINQNITANGGGSVNVQARNDVNLANNRRITATGGGTITATADSDNSGVGDFVAAAANSQLRNAGGDITVSGRNVTLGTVNANFGTGINNGGDISVTATGGNVNLRNVVIAEAAGVAGSQSGDITISATGDVGAIGTAGGRGQFRTRNIAGGGGATNKTGGDISVTAGGNITVRNIDTRARRNGGTGGSVTLNAGGDVTTQQAINTYAYSGANNTGGAVTVTAGGNVLVQGQTRTDASNGDNGRGGDVSVTSTGGNVTFTRNNNNDVYTRAGRNGIGGSVTISAANGAISLGTNNRTFADTRGGTTNNTTGTAGAITMTAQSIDARRDLVADGGRDGGTAGAVNLNATAGDLQVRSIFARGGSDGQNAGTGNGANVTLTGTNIVQANGEQIQTTSNRRNGTSGSFVANASGNVTLGNINTQSSRVAGAGGIIDINAGGDVQTGSLVSQGVGAGSIGGAVTVDSTGGNIATGIIDTDADQANGQAGLVRLTTPTGNISITGNIDTTANQTNGQAGNITLTANAGSIASTADIISRSNGANGRAGNISLNAGTSIAVRDVITEGYSTTSAGAGNATLTAGTTLAVRNVTTRSNGPANGGTATIAANGNIAFTGTIDTTSRDGNGGAVSMTSANGNVVANNRFIRTWSRTANGGDITVSATNGLVNLGTGNNAFADSRGAVTGGQTGNAGNITITGNTVTAQRDFLARSGTAGGTGGAVNITANTGNMRVRTVDTRGSGGTGDAGDITLTAPGQVQLDETIFANAGATSGTGGDITITAATTRLAGNTNAQITSTGGASGGSISISGEVRMDRNKTITTGAAGGNITIGGGIETTTGGNRDLTINAGVGSVTIGGDIGATNARRSRHTTITGSTISLNNIMTQGNGRITLNGDVRLLGDTRLDAHGNGNVTVTGTIDGTGAGGQNLIIDPNNRDAILGGAIGSNTRVGAVTFTGNANRTVGMVDIFTNGGDVTVGQHARLNANTTIDTLGGAVTFNRDVTGVSAGGQSLSIDTNGGDVTFNRRIGATRLGALTVADAGNVTFNSNNTIQTSGVTVSNATGAVSSNRLLDTDGGNVSIRGASVALTGVNTRNPTAGGDAGDVSLTATASPLVVAYNIDARGTNNGAGAGGNGGNVTLNGTSVTLTTAPLVTGGNAGGGAFDGGDGGAISVTGSTIDLNTNLNANAGAASGAGTRGDGGNITLRGATNISANRSITTIGDTGGDVAILGGLDGTAGGLQLTVTTGDAASTQKGNVRFGTGAAPIINPVDVVVNRAASVTGSVDFATLTLNDSDRADLFGRINGIGGDLAAQELSVNPTLDPGQYFVNRCDAATGDCIRPINTTASVDVFKLSTERSIETIETEISMDDFKSGESRRPAIVAFCSEFSAEQCVNKLSTLVSQSQTGKPLTATPYDSVVYFDQEEWSNPSIATLPTEDILSLN